MFEQRRHRKCVRRCKSKYLKGFLHPDTQEVVIDLLDHNPPLQSFGFYMRLDLTTPQGPEYIQLTGISRVIFRYDGTPTLEEIEAEYGTDWRYEFEDSFYRYPYTLETVLGLSFDLVLTASHWDHYYGLFGFWGRLSSTDEEPSLNQCGLDQYFHYTGYRPSLYPFGLADSYSVSEQGASATYSSSSSGHSAVVTHSYWPIETMPVFLPGYEGANFCNAPLACGGGEVKWCHLLVSCDGSYEDRIFYDEDAFDQLPGTGDSFRIGSVCYRDAGRVRALKNFIETVPIAERFESCAICEATPVMCGIMRRCEASENIIHVELGLLSVVSGTGSVYLVDGICREKIGEILAIPDLVSDVWGSTFAACGECQEGYYVFPSCPYIIDSTGECGPQTNAPQIRISATEWEQLLLSLGAEIAQRSTFTFIGQGAPLGIPGRSYLYTLRTRGPFVGPPNISSGDMALHLNTPCFVCHTGPIDPEPPYEFSSSPPGPNEDISPVLPQGKTPRDLL